MSRYACRLAALVAAAGISFACMAADEVPVSPLDEKAALRASQAVIGQPVGEHLLRDREGREMRLARYRGKPLVVQFIYTGCYQVCPATTQFLSTAVVAAQKALSADAFNTLSIGFNLPFDTPQAMKSFARQQGIKVRNWEFASPDAATLDALTREFGFTYVATPKGFDHLLQVTILDQEGRVYRQIYGESFSAPLFVGPLLELVNHSPKPATGIIEWVEQVKLLCTVYDPTSGKYRVNYAVLIELLVGASVILGGVTVLAVEWRRRRRAARAASL
ncbi:MAG: SCO family protein [Betaproteobacteria bacterium]|nr:SCO family protein [Betaproteobacteria bacterium]